MKVSVHQLSLFAAGAVVGGLAVGSLTAGRDPAPPDPPPRAIAANPQPTALPRSSSHSYREEIGDDLGVLERMEEIDLHRAIEDLDSRALLDLAIDVGRHSFSRGSSSHRQKTILARLAELDPEAALRFANEWENREFNPFLPVVESLAKHHPQRALALLDEVGDQGQRNQIINAIAHLGSPESAMDLIGALGDSERVHLWSNSAGSLGEMFDEGNLDQGLAFMAKISDRKGQMNFLREVLGNVADGNPQLALQLLDAHGPKTKRESYVLRSLAEGWIKHDPNGARAWLSTLELPSERLSVMKAFLQSVERDGASHAWLANEIAQFVDDGGDAPHLVSDYSRTLAEADPEAAVEWLRGLSELPYGALTDHGQTNHFFNAWMRDDPDGALGYLGTLDPAEAVYNDVAKGILTRLARSDPAGAAAYALGIESELKDRILRPVIGSWVRRDVGAAGAWIEGLRGTDQYYGAINVLVGNIANTDPEQAAATLGQAYAGFDADGVSNFNQSMRELGEIWAQSDPAAAAAWAIELPPSSSDYRSQIVGKIFEEWVDFDQHEASSWLTTLEPGHQRDAAIEVLIKNIRSTDPAAAFQWAMTVSTNEATRSARMRQALAHLRLDDSEVARGVVESAAGLSDEERAAILSDW